MSQNDKTIDERSAIINTIVANFYKVINSGDGDNKRLLLLIAALSILNSNLQSGQATSAARRLTQLAMQRRNSKRG
jgi:hypothetical protein